MAWLLLLLTFAGLVSLHPLSLPYRGAALAGTLSALLAVGIAMWIRPRGNAARASACLALVLIVIGGKHIADRYLADRYRLGDFPHPNEPMANALANTYNWVQGLRHERIALDGGELQYPLYGPDLSNYVQYLGHTDRSGGFERISSCRAWRRAINVGRFRYVMTVPFGSESNSPPEPSPQAAWTASDPATQIVLRPGASITIFAIRTPMHPSSCPS